MKNQLNGHEFGKLRETVKDREAWHVLSVGSQKVGCDLVTEQQIGPPEWIFQDGKFFASL